MFSVCLSVHRGGGYPSLWSQVLSRKGGTPSPVTDSVKSAVPGPAGGEGYRGPEWGTPLHPTGQDQDGRGEGFPGPK